MRHTLEGLRLGIDIWSNSSAGTYSLYPEDMKDEDVEQVVFEDFTINIAEEGSEDDILLRRR